ncbi:MAG: hypothetical protein WAN36_14800, partial [Calditrichia bacterium]
MKTRLLILSILFLFGAMGIIHAEKIARPFDQAQLIDQNLPTKQILAGPSVIKSIGDPINLNNSLILGADYIK